jgi:myo-inositol-1-phosphate synthase
VPTEVGYLGREISYADSTLAASTSRKSVLVRMPDHVKKALVRETARRGVSLNDVATGFVAAELGIEYMPTGRRSPLPGASPVVLLRVPETLKHALEAEASRSSRSINDVVVGALADGLAIPLETSQRKDTMAATNGSKNGARSKDKVRVAIIGAGNCANSLLQGVEYYKDAARDDTVPGLMHIDLGGYHISDIEFVAAFDVVKGKVGVDLADAVWAHPNDTIEFAKVKKTGVTVSRGMTHDGIGKYLGQVVEKAPGETDDVVGILKETGADVVVNYLPVGSEAAAKWYAEQVLEAGVAMVNCMPVFIARERYWQKRFERAGVPIIGDDIKSQVGATITHRVLTTLFGDRGVHLDRTMQLNVGGNSDFRNMLERDRLESKKISKTNAVTSMLDYEIGEGNVHVGPSDFVPWLTDRKWAYIRMEGSGFGDVPLNCELKLEVWDSPNSAGIVIDAVRLAKLALDNGIAGALEAPSSYLMKSPPRQIRDDESRELIERFIAKNARTKAKAATKA